MRWFKHYADAYSNIKHQQVIAEVGLKGYGFYWVCLELVAQQGVKFRIDCTKNWKIALTYTTRATIDEVDAFLQVLATANLIDKKALENNDLFIPKMAEYADEYTKRVRSVSRQHRVQLGLEQNRTDKKRTEQKKIGIPFDEFWSLYPKKVNKQKSELKWYTLEDPVRQKILTVLPKQCASQVWTKDGGQFIPHPTTYLNNERWMDEVELPKANYIKI